MSKKQKFVAAINTSDGRRFEKGTKVVQVISGGEAEVNRIIDEGSVLVYVTTPNGRPFQVISPVKELLPVTDEESANIAENLNEVVLLDG